MTEKASRRLKSWTKRLLLKEKASSIKEFSRDISRRLSRSGPDELIEACRYHPEAKRFLDRAHSLCDWDNKRTQWWYFTGHMTNETGRPFAFELVFFVRRTARDFFGPISIALRHPVLHVAHFALHDPKASQADRRFRYWEKGGIREPASGFASQNHMQLEVGNWSARQNSRDRIMLSARADDVSLHLELDPKKALVFHGDRGLSAKNRDGSITSFYCTYPRLEGDGHLVIGKEVHQVSGSAWMDHEKMTDPAGLFETGWDWLSLQFDHGEECMIYSVRHTNEPEFVQGSWIHADGSVTALHGKDIQLGKPLEYWTSSQSGARYPIRRRVKILPFKVDLEVTALVPSAELDVMKSSFITYWEGAMSARGKMGRKRLSGHGFLEQVGYDSRFSTKVLQFLMG